MSTARKAVNLSAVLLAAVLLAPAGASEPVRMQVPFSFTVHETHMAAGEYEVSYSGPDTIHLKSERGSAYLLTPSGRSARMAPRLVFNRYGKEYFLCEIWIGNSVRRLPRSEREEELLQNGAKPETATLRARR